MTDRDDATASPRLGNIPLPDGAAFTDGSTVDDDNPASIGQLVGQLTDHGMRLVHAEIGYAKAELKTKAGEFGGGIGLIVVAGGICFYAFAVFLAAAVAGLANVVPVWLSALIIGGAMVLLAASMVGIAIFLFKKGSRAPESIDSVKHDVTAVKEAATHTSSKPAYDFVADVFTTAGTKASDDEPASDKKTKAAKCPKPHKMSRNELRQEINMSRSNLGSTIDELTTRFTPKYQANRAKKAAQKKAASFTSAVKDKTATVKEKFTSPQP
ncbi:MAG: phage holin family protein [Cellulomonadaceae bacterium]|jgi:hypothetical protein|nr:phage holin family protein [Cellulomonadaceae bacterium]